jgi:hypothetical protein
VSEKLLPSRYLSESRSQSYTNSLHQVLITGHRLGQDGEVVVRDKSYSCIFYLAFWRVGELGSWGPATRRTLSGTQKPGPYSKFHRIAVHVSPSESVRVLSVSVSPLRAPVRVSSPGPAGPPRPGPGSARAGGHDPGPRWQPATGPDHDDSDPLPLARYVLTTTTQSSIPPSPSHAAAAASQ